MGKRAGEFVTLDDVIDEVGRDATRYFYLMRRHDTPLEFDLEVAKRQSMDNPVYYVQYGARALRGDPRRAARAGGAAAAARSPELAARAGAARGDRDPAPAGRLPGLRGRRGRRARAAPADDLPDRAGGRVPELLHPPAEGARRHHPAPGAPPDGRLAGDLELAQDGGAALLGRRHRPGDAQRARRCWASPPPRRWRARRIRLPRTPQSRKRTIHDGAIHCGRQAWKNPPSGTSTETPSGGATRSRCASTTARCSSCSSAAPSSPACCSCWA